MMKIANILIVLASLISGLALGQGVYFDPSPTDVTGNARLYVDISSPDCSNCGALQDADPDTNPIYIWTWNPNEARGVISVDGTDYDITNGSWDSSNESMVMSQDPENPNLWYYDFVGATLVNYYQAPAASFYDTGIDFLIKEKNGNSPGDGEPEQKSDDMNIVLEPIGCFEKICPFPTTFFQDQYFFINYDNNQETIGFLQNMGPDECLIWFRVSINGGSEIIYRDETDKYKMNYDGDGLFSLSMIPEEYFELQEGDELTYIDAFITKAPINVPPFTQPIRLIPGCE